MLCAFCRMAPRKKTSSVLEPSTITAWGCMYPYMWTRLWLDPMAERQERGVGSLST